ncbi:MAG: family 78 glycoside hydrolase catalytic domain [Candidatus Helarchaeota archaeon]
MSKLSNLKVNHLRCEYLINPLGIDVPDPRLSWVLESDKRGDFQSAYRIIVSSSKDLIDNNQGDLWDTGKIESNAQNQIVYNGKPLKSRMECFWKVMVWDMNNNPSTWSNIAYWSMGLLSPDDWNAKWIGNPKRKFFLRKLRRLFRKRKIDPSPLLRKKISIQNPISKAIVYVSALGEYELFINGVKVGDYIFSPEWTDYDKRVQYQTFDVSKFLQSGDNVIGAVLADGWYIGNIGFFVGSRVWGNDRRFLFQLEITYSNGESQVISSDDSWKIFNNGPIRRADHYLGEIYDSNLEVYGWGLPNFDDSNWDFVVVDDSINTNLVSQKNEPIRIVKELSPISISEPIPGIFIFDIGQNIAGWCKIFVNSSLCDKGSTITLRHGEILNLDGTLYTKNLRSAKAIDKFIYNGSDSIEFHPHFTYHGFQFVEVSGLKNGAKPDLNFLKACVISSDTTKTGDFQSSDPMLNKLWNNIFWTQVDNLISVPTDCPQRDERLGWMGDALIFAQTSIFNMDMASFYSKWIKDIRDAQTKSGRYSDFCPNPFIKLGLTFTLNAPGWADCGVILPWILYLNYGDKRIIEQHYTSAKKFIDLVYSKNPDFLWTKLVGIDYSDWLNGSTIKHPNYPKKRGKIPKKVFSTAFFYKSTLILSKMANLLGLYDDANYYQDLASHIKNVFNEHFVDDSAIITGNTQAGYSMALNFGLLPDHLLPKAIDNLIKSIEFYDFRISTGFHTTLLLMMELANHNHLQIAYQILQSKRFPSWYYMIDNGATTMWERWDGFVKGRKKPFQTTTMNSFNHYSIGSVGEWIYRVILGINLDEKNPGFKHFIINPRPGGSLTWAKGHYISIYGKILVDWKIQNDNFNLIVSIPCNTTSTIFIPCSEPNTITENGSPIKNSNLIRLIEFKNGVAILELQSGSYHFNTKL